MRVTNDMISRQVRSDLTSNLIKIQNSQSQLSSLKRISQPSDDPVGVSQLLLYKGDLAELEQYQKNIENGKDWLTTTSDTLSSVEDVIMKIIDLGITGSSELGDIVERNEALANQVDEYLKELVDLANTQSGNKYIFAGTQTLTSPFVATDSNDDGYIDTVTPNASGIDGDINRSVGRDLNMVVNSKGDAVFQPTQADSSDIFQVVMDIRDALLGGTETVGDVNGLLDDLDTALDRITSENALVGAKINRLESASERLDVQILNQTGRISNIEDADYVEVMLDYQAQQNAYQASLSVASQLIQMSLVDYLS